MSKRAIRRGMSKRAAIAASSVLAVGGSLAVVSSASALQITSSDMSSISSQLNQAMIQAGEVDQAATSSAGDTLNTLPTSPAITSSSTLTSTQISDIETDWANTSNEPYYVGVLTQETGSSSTAQSDYNTLQATVASYSSTSTQLQELLALSAAGAKSFPNGLFSVDGDLTVSSSATVTTANTPTALTMNIGTTTAAKGGFALPKAFTITFPSSYKLSPAVAAKAIKPTQEAAPPASNALGSLVVTTPALQYLLKSSSAPINVKGNIYAVKLSKTTVGLEIDADGFYDLSSAITTTDGAMTASFGEFQGDGQPLQPLPLSNMKITFPAATSPVEATSCTTLGSVTGTGTDEAAALAYQLGDTTDGYSGSGSAGPVDFGSTATTVTNDCKVAAKITASKGSASGISKGKPSFGFTLSDNKDFNSFTVTLPKGFKFSKFSSKDLKLSGGAVKSVSTKGTKLTVKLNGWATSVKAKLSGGMTVSKSAKKDKKVTLKIGASGKTASLKIKA